MECIDTERLKTLIEEHNASLVIGNGSDIHLCFGSGVSDLYRLYTTMPQLLHSAIVVDKVVGKGAAALMMLGGVKEVYAYVISRVALNLLDNSDIKVCYARLVENIINRKGDDICPVEKRCKDAITPQECFPLIQSFLQSLKP